MNDKDIYILGAGTYGEAMFELATIDGYNVKAFYEKDGISIGTTVMGVEVLLETEDIFVEGRKYIVAIGNNKLRNKIMTKINDLGGITPTIVHPSAIISPSAKIGKGVYIQANAYIWTKVIISDFCIISPGVVIAHHSNIGKACLISTLTGIGASINIEDNVFIGMGATIVTGMSLIGENSIIGEGAVVLKDIEKNSVYAGVPAKKIRDIY